MTGSAGVRVRTGGVDDADACAAVVAELPDHFSADVVGKVRDGLAVHRSWVAGDGASVVGFAVVDHRAPEVAEILWAAVSATRRRRGVGTVLVERVLAELGGSGVRLVEVKTLDPAAEYAPYVETYRFWIRRGFVHVDTIDPLPGWEPGNPCAILVAALAPTLPAR